MTVADALLATHRSYLSVLRPVIDRQLAKGLAHITGGGITENLPRILPDGVGAESAAARGKSRAVQAAAGGRRVAETRCSAPSTWAWG